MWYGPLGCVVRPAMVTTAPWPQCCLGSGRRTSGTRSWQVLRFSLLVVLAAAAGSGAGAASGSGGDRSLCTIPGVENATKSALSLALSSARVAIGAVWPTVCNASHLDPTPPLLGGSTTSIDHKDGCDEICGAQLASCHSFGLRLGSATLLGLGSMNFTNILLSNLTLHSNETCSSNASSGSPAAVACGINGGADITAALSTKVMLDVQSGGGGIRVECKDAFKKWSELLWKGKGHCTASTRGLQAHIRFCGASCAPGKSKDLAALAGATVSKLNFNFDHLDCSFGAGKGKQRCQVHLIFDMGAVRVWHSAQCYHPLSQAFRTCLRSPSFFRPICSKISLTVYRILWRAR
jgi:hypothetical protein